MRVSVVRVQHWAMNAFVAERFRQGRILLAGDAAHAVPIIGGLGMNAGVADAHNLCWKLTGVLHEWAGPGLLDTYERERQPVAHLTLRQAVANAQLLLQAQDQRREQLRHGQAAPAGIEPPWSGQYFAQLGLVLGVTYHSDAVLPDDGGPPEPYESGTDHVPTAEPGRRMPHLWLAHHRSTLDTLGEWFTLLTPDPTYWEHHTTPPWPLRVEALPGEHTDLCGFHPRGAVLVRPDGHIAARWRDRPPSGAALHHALTAITQS
ncbi:FAD-dependent monooxygenase [Streptomyces sp. NPDC052309]|uniref:FAD-dependent monooxygenase n=1 Tax=Streptomyces sp. NPDC052309 TaxID=3155421 RepID=UPI00341B1E77